MDTDIDRLPVDEAPKDASFQDDALQGEVRDGLPQQALRPWASLPTPEVHAEFWVEASELFPRSRLEGPFAVDVPLVTLARSLSRRAAELSSMGDDMAGKAAWLYIRAAERKRVAGAPVEAFEDYVALSRHYLAVGRLKPAIAYMRKARHVSDLSGEPRNEVLTLRLTASVHKAAGQMKEAAEVARRARDMAVAAGLADLVTDPVVLLKGPSNRTKLHCNCGEKGIYASCCGAADVPPVEYSVEMPRPFSEGPPTPFRQRRLSGIETLMRPPTGAELSTWYVWRVEDGCYRLVAYANWSSRAMKAAEAMARIADGPDSAEATSSAVLQSFVALESFLTSWKAHMRRETGNRHWPTPMGTKRDDKGAHVDGGSNFTANWAAAAIATFGADWRLTDAEGFNALARIRNTLCHQVSATVTVIPSMQCAEDEQVLDCLRSRGIDIGPWPAPMIDRIMVEGVAAWAVEVARTQISAVRAAWDLASERCDQDDRWAAEEADDRHDEFGDPLRGYMSEPVAEERGVEGPVVARGASLREIAAARRCVIAAMDDAALDPVRPIQAGDG